MREEKNVCVFDQEFDAGTCRLHVGDLARSRHISHYRRGEHHSKITRMHQIDITLIDHPIRQNTCKEMGMLGDTSQDVT